MGGSRRMCGPIFVGSVRNYQAGSRPDILARRMASAIKGHVGPRAKLRRAAIAPARRTKSHLTAVARAEPNGYTIGTPTTPTPSFLIAGLVKKPQYDPARCPLEPLMQENFRQFLDRLRQAGELVDIHQPVDIRHISTLVDQAKTALFFHRVIGYDMPLVSGIIRSRERATMALGCDTYGEIEHKLQGRDRQADPAEARENLAHARSHSRRRRRRSLQNTDPDVVDL